MAENSQIKQVVEYINCYGNKVTFVLINLYNAGGDKNDDRWHDWLTVI